MVVKKLNLRLFRQVKDTKGQFISITIMVVIALAIFISMNMVSDNLSVSLETFYEITNFTDVFTEVVRIPQSALPGLESIPGVMKAQGRITKDLLFKTENQDEKVRVRINSLPQGEHLLNDNYAYYGIKTLKTIIMQPF
jgi:putative ABC transport system permease protein